MVECNLLQRSTLAFKSWFVYHIHKLWVQQYVPLPYIIFQVCLGLFYNYTGCSKYNNYTVLFSTIFCCKPEKIAVNFIERPESDTLCLGMGILGLGAWNSHCLAESCWAKLLALSYLDFSSINSDNPGVQKVNLWMCMKALRLLSEKHFYTCQWPIRIYVNCKEKSLLIKNNWINQPFRLFLCLASIQASSLQIHLVL